MSNRVLQIDAPSHVLSSRLLLRQCWTRCKHTKRFKERKYSAHTLEPFEHVCIYLSYIPGLPYLLMRALQAILQSDTDAASMGSGSPESHGIFDCLQVLIATEHVEVLLHASILRRMMSDIEHRYNIAPGEVMVHIGKFTAHSQFTFT